METNRNIGLLATSSRLLAPIIALSLACHAPPKQPDAPCGAAQTQDSAHSAPANAAQLGWADPQAAALAAEVLERMGGAEAWNRTRWIEWNFFDRRHHHWDRWTGDIVVEMDDQRVWANLNSDSGRAEIGAVPVTDPVQLKQMLSAAKNTWINDAYWMFMPYKLRDPGTRLVHAGFGEMADGRSAQVLELTFEGGAGNTPQNRYLVFVAEDSGLVEQWSFFANAADEEAALVGPWTDWFETNGIWLSASRGRGFDWKIAIHTAEPAVFNSASQANE